MPSLYDLKPAFQNCLHTLVAALAQRGVSANQVTVVALLLSLLGGLLIALAPAARWPLLLLPALLFIRMALNAMDGMLAREYANPTPLGGLLNELGDVIADTVLYLPLALVPGVPAPLVVLLVILSLLTELTGVVAVQIGARRGYAGPLGKSDRALLLGTVALLLGLGVAPGAWLSAVLLLANGLLLLTIYNRARQALCEAGESAA